MIPTGRFSCALSTFLTSRIFNRSFHYLSGSYGCGIPYWEVICDTFAISAHCPSKDRDTRRDRVSRSPRHLSGQLHDGTLVPAICPTMQPDSQQSCAAWTLPGQGRAVQALVIAIGQRPLFVCIYLDGFELCVPVLLAVVQGENSELTCCNKESTVVDAMWGAGSKESAERLEMACESRIITSTRTITP